ncbi:hypothetical protein ACFX1R_045828 [Malus domestica]
MSGPFDRRFDLNLGEEASMLSPDNIWRISFISPTGPLIVRDSMMKNDMTTAVVARNLVTPKDNRLFSKRSDELAVKDSLALSMQCASSVSNMAQHLFARARQVESLAAEVMSLKQEIRGLKHENKQLHRLAHNYATNMKRKMTRCRNLMVRFYLIIRGLWVCSNSICLRLLGLYLVVKLQMINLRCLLLLWLCRLLKLLLNNLCEGSLLYFSASCSFSTNFNVKYLAYLSMFQK